MPEPSRLTTTRRSDRPRAHQGTSDTEAAIFAATERLLADEPLHELSVAQIIAEAGISRATFYFYFSSKFAVVVGLLAQVMEEIFDAVRPFVNRDDDAAPDIALRQSLEAGVDLWARHRPAMRAIHEHWSTSEELRELWLSVMERFTQALAAEIDRQRAAGLAEPGVDSGAIASTLLWGTETCLYIAGLGVDTSFPDENAALEPLLAVWMGTLFGTRTATSMPAKAPAKKSPSPAKRASPRKRTS